MILVYAHHSKSGHCGIALATVLHELKKHNTSYELWDLYEMKFDPIYNPETHDVLGPDHLSMDPTIRQFQEKIRAHTDFIFIYPTWWGNVPAILKGFYDRVLNAHFAFRYTKYGLPEGLLKGKRALVITTSGSPTWYQWLFKGCRSLRITTTDTLAFCGIRTRTLLIGSSIRFTDARARIVEQKVARILKSWLKY